MDDLIGLCVALLLAGLIVMLFATALTVAIVFFIVWGVLELSAWVYGRRHGLR